MAGSKLADLRARRAELSRDPAEDVERARSAERARVEAELRQAEAEDRAQQVDTLRAKQRRISEAYRLALARLLERFNGLDDDVAAVVQLAQGHKAIEARLNALGTRAAPILPAPLVVAGCSAAGLDHARVIATEAARLIVTRPTTH